MTSRFDAALSTIERETEAATRRLGATLLRAWARPLVAGIAIVTGLGLGSWGLAQWQWRRIESRIETKAALELDIQEYRRTLRELEEQTRGVRIVERANGTFAVLPARAETGWTVGGRAAVKLPDWEAYDRAREAAERGLAVARRAIRAGAEAAGRVSRGLAGTAEHVRAVARRTGRGLRAARQGPQADRGRVELQLKARERARSQADDLGWSR